jgi:hypothetical protein
MQGLQISDMIGNGTAQYRADHRTQWTGSVLSSYSDQDCGEAATTKWISLHVLFYDNGTNALIGVLL